MLVLAIDTALAATQVCILDGGRIRSALSRPMQTGHAEALVPMVEAARDAAGVPFRAIDRIAVTRGPGTFAGIRIGLSAARAYALALDVPAVGVETLDALAAEAGPDDEPLLAVIDARRDEVYARSFAPGGTPRDAAHATTLAVLAREVQPGPLRAIGSAAPALARVRGGVSIVGAPPAPSIVAVARLGAAAPAPIAAPTPLYLRPPDAKPQVAPLARRA
jgi:tRNA threonylcarbamoyl adenosine modification protein YeaZ